MEEVQTGDRSQEGHNKCHWAVKSWHQSQEKGECEAATWCFRIWFFFAVPPFVQTGNVFWCWASLARSHVRSYKSYLMVKTKANICSFYVQSKREKREFWWFNKVLQRTFQTFCFEKNCDGRISSLFHTKKKNRKMWQPNKHPKNFLWLKSKILKLWSML